MIKDILTKAKSAISQPIGQPAQVVAAEPAKPAPKVEVPSPAAAPAKKLTAKEQSEQTAKQVGYNPGDEVGAVICRHQPARHPHLLFVEVPDWAVPVRCWVKDAASWLPSNPPHNRLKARYTGMASVEGDLIFESSDVSRKARLLKTR
jgi:hypothetical protein